MQIDRARKVGKGISVASGRVKGINIERSFRAVVCQKLCANIRYGRGERDGGEPIAGSKHAIAYALNAFGDGSLLYLTEIEAAVANLAHR